MNIDDEKPIDTWNVLRNPDSQISKGLMIIYSMETFLPFELNIAERTKDECKIISLGPFAKALNEITWQAQSNKQNNKNLSETPVYRGVRMSRESYNEIIQK